MAKKFPIKFLKLLLNIRELIQLVIELIKYIKSIKADAKLQMFKTKIETKLEDITGRKLNDL